MILLRISYLIFFFNCSSLATHSFNPEQILASLTLEEKIGQLFIATCIIDQKENAAIVAHKGYATDINTIKRYIAKYHIGGVIYLGMGTVEPQILATQEFQQASKTPLLIAMDFERGLTMRLHDAPRFPYNMTLGALNDNQLIYQMGAEIARECKLIGVHINLAPVADVNNNPANPVINDRSFGQDPEKVAQKAIAYMQGLQDNGILACAKHFPGHGDVNTDSHHELPQVTHNIERLHAVELYPFKKLIDSNISMIMTAFLEVPALESEQKKPAALSKNIVTHLLKEQLGFQGLVVTDGLDMAGATQYAQDQDIALQALLAGNDLLICSRNIPASIESIQQAIEAGLLTNQELDQKVLKILHAKAWALEQQVTAKAQSQNILFSSEAADLKKQLFSQTITIAQDRNQLLPLTPSSCTVITFSKSNKKSTFTQALSSYCHVAEMIISDQHTNLIELMESYKTDVVIINLLSMTRFAAQNFGITQSMLEAFHSIRLQGKKIIFVVFGNPYSLKQFHADDTILIGYENDTDAQEAAAHVLIGKLPAQGALPVTC